MEHNHTSGLSRTVMWVSRKLMLWGGPGQAGGPPHSSGPEDRRPVPSSLSPKLWLHEADAEAGAAASSHCPQLLPHVASLPRACSQGRKWPQTQVPPHAGSFSEPELVFIKGSRCSSLLFCGKKAWNWDSLKTQKVTLWPALGPLSPVAWISQLR